jgi:hypothetical protein
MEGWEMNRIKQMFSVALVLAFASLSLTAQAQYSRPYRVSTQQVRQLIQRLETRTETFRTSLSAAVNQSSYDNTRAEDNVNLFVSDFTSSLRTLHDRFDRRESTTSDVQDVLNRANRIDAFMRRVSLGGGVAGDWAAVRTDLNELARDYNITWRWNAQVNNTSNNYPNNNYPTNNYPSNNYPSNNYPSGNQGNYASRLTGTYQLDTTRSDDARNIANNAVRSLPYRDRQRVLDSLTARLESPTMIAIDRHGRNVTIASTRRAQFSFDADGIEHVETGADGHQVRVRATLSGDQLSIASSGDRDRESDFEVTFEPINDGRGLRVTRRIMNANLNTPVTVVSVYQRTSDVAQLDIYNGSTNNYPNNTTGTISTSGDFIVPDGTEIVATLNTNLTTRDTRENDRFTMTVQQPSQYYGATINGYVTNVNRSGRITGRSQMTLNFDSITLRDGRSYKFAGITETVQTANGQTVRVDNEGAVRDNNRTTTTEQRAAVGTAIGAIIGAIAGGGRGAAVGAILGAGAGAGSVYIEGRDDLELVSGTQMTIRASAPR